MILSDFLKAYRKGINKATGAALSIRALSELLGVGQDRLTKWEGSETVRGSLPKHDSDKNSIKKFFGISDFLNISENELKIAIENYPKPVTNQTDNTNSQKTDKQQIDIQEDSLSTSKEHVGTFINDNGSLTSQYTNNENDMNLQLLIKANQDSAQAVKDIAKANLMLVEMLQKKFGEDYGYGRTGSDSKS